MRKGRQGGRTDLVSDCCGGVKEGEGMVGDFGDVCCISSRVAFTCELFTMCVYSFSQ